MKGIYLSSALLIAILAVGAPAQTVNINCGGQGLTTSDGTQWVADNDFNGGDLLYTGYGIANTSVQDLPLWRSGRAGLYGDFSYNVPVPNGTYNVTLLFAEIEYSAAGQRVFNVVLNGNAVLTNFDILAHVAPLTPYMRQFPVSVTNGAVSIEVNGVVQRGLLNGIQIAPSSGTVTTPAPAPTAVLSVGSTALSFSATAGAGNPAAQKFGVTNSGGGTLAWTAASNRSWLAISPANGSGSGSVTVQPNISGLAAGTYTGAVTISASGATGSPATVAVTLAVAPDPAPAPSTATLPSISINCGGDGFTTSDGTAWSGDQYYSGGQNVYTSYAIANTNLQDLYLYRSGRAGLYGDFSYAIPVANGTYAVTLRFAEVQYSAVGQRVFNVSINGKTVLSNFDILAHVAPLTPLSEQFTANVTNGVLRIDFTGVVNRGLVNAIQVAASTSQPVVAPALTLSGTSLSFSGTAGGSNPAAKTVSVSNTGGGTLTWTASANQNWLGVSPASGTAPGSISIQPKLSGLAAGTYTGVVTVNAAGATGAPQTIAVSLSVAAAPTVLTASTNSLSFFATAGGANPAQQFATVSNTGAGTLSWTAVVNKAWLTVSPASGTNSGTLAIGVNIAGLGTGSYSGAVTVSGGGATKTILVGLTLAAAVTPPALSVSSGALSFSATAGSNPSAQAFAVSNSGGGTLSWTASSNQGWLTVSPGSGTNSGSVTASVTCSAMSAGTYAAAITVNAGTAGSKTVSVTLNVSAGSTNPPPATSGNSWYVTTGGTSSGDGSMAHPWDIVTALAGPASVKPGDTIWIRAGKYGDGQYNSVINSHLVGTATQPITVRAYPGERVTIDAWLQIGCCDGAPNPAAGSYTWFWGLEFASFNSNRTSGTSGPPEWAFMYNHPSADVWGAGTKLINCIVHDTSGGFSVWNAADSEVNGNIVFNVGGYGTDRGHGHDFYMQNAAPSVLRLTDNIGFNNFDMGLQAYGSSDSYVQNIQLTGNIIFNSGVLYGQLVDNLTLGGGSGGPSGMVVKNNYFYDTPTTDQGYNELGFLWDPGDNDAVVTGNYFIGGKQAIDLERWYALTFQNNTIYSAVEQEGMLIYRDNQNPANYVDGNNKYYGTGQFIIYPNCDTWPCPTSQTVNFSNWQAITGLDKGGTFTAGAPTGVWTTVRPNQYEPGRANVVIYNWDLKPGVSVDLSSSGIQVGDTYQVRDAENWYGGPVASGTYTGAPVTIPMTGLTVVQPFGSVPYEPSHTAPQFGVFVLLSGQALANTY